MILFLIYSTTSHCHMWKKHTHSSIQPDERLHSVSTEIIGVELYEQKSEKLMQL